MYIGYDNVLANDPMLTYYYSGEGEEHILYELGIRGHEEPHYV